MDNYYPRPKNGMIVLGARNSNMGKQIGYDVFPRAVRAQILQKQLAQRFAGSTGSSQLERIRRGFHRSPGNPAPMTIELQGPRAKLHGSMDAYPPSPDLYNIESDHTIPNSDLGAYAASPNSLYMYEQEKHDMQNSMVSSLCNPSVSVPVQIKEEFDLKPQYENSNLDLSVAGSPANPDTVGIPSKLWNTSETLFDPEVSSDSTLFPMEGASLSSGPTLAELNMLNMDDSSLMEEVWSLVSNDSAFDASVLCSKRDNSSPLAKVPGVQTPKVQRSADMQQSSLTMLLSSQLTKGQTPATDLRPSPVKIPTSSVSQIKSLFPTSTPSWTLTGASSRPASHTAVSQSVLLNERTVSGPKDTDFQRDDKLTLQKLLQRKPIVPQSQSLPSQSMPVPQTGMKRTATVAKFDIAEEVEEKWKEIEKYIHEPKPDDAKSSTSSRSKRSRHDSGSSAQTSYEDQDSDNDVFSDRDSDLDDDLSEEEGTLSQLSPLEESLTGNGKKKEKQFFWQYNVQSKGPKGTRLRLEMNSSDPYELKEFEDPVFDPNNTYVAGIRHGGKARKGDGNDVHPNPKRLVQIGMQIKRLNRKINEVTALGEGTAAARSHSRKEKNKLASRACRLKKKAQHEANKVKLFGLEREHRQLMEVMVSIKAELKRHLLERGETTPKKSLVEELEKLIKTHLKEMIAGHTADYVNKVIAAYERGDPCGGLNIRKK